MRQVNADILVEKAKDEAKSMSEPFKSNFAVLVEWLVEKTSTIEPGPQWIPVSERLPEEDTDVLISYRYKEGEGDTAQSYIDITSYGDLYFGGNPVHDIIDNKIKHWRQPFAYFTSNYEVIAWMPLPEPYKEDDNA